MTDHAGVGETPASSSPGVRPLHAVARDATDNGLELTETEEFCAFYRENFAALVNLVHLMGASYSVAADYAQDTMIKALPPKWAQLDNPRAWVKTAAVRNYIRDTARCREDLVGEFELTGNSLVGSEAEVTARAEQVEVIRLLQQLPLRQRQVAACVLDGMSHPEICEALDMAAGTSRTTWWQAKRNLAQLMRTSGGPR